MAKDKIMGIIAEPEVGVVYTGTVVKLMDFGAFVNFFPSKDGLVHISQITGAERGDKPADLLKEGQSVKVKLLGFDERGKEQQERPKHKEIYPPRKNINHTQSQDT
jgi:polyribonucleotide nucleotidyltransferase